MYVRGQQLSEQNITHCEMKETAVGGMQYARRAQETQLKEQNWLCRSSSSEPSAHHEECREPDTRVYLFDRLGKVQSRAVDGRKGAAERCMDRDTRHGKRWQEDWRS